MSNVQDVREKRFWNKCFATLKDQHMKSTVYPWFVRHCEQFIRHHASLRLKQHSREDDTDYRANHPVERIDYSIEATGRKTPSAHDQQINDLRIAIRCLNYSIRTEKAYTDWVGKFLHFHKKDVVRC